MTDRERIKKALSAKKKKLAKSNAFKPMSRQATAYTQCSDADAETLEALTEKLKNAKDKKKLKKSKIYFRHLLLQLKENLCLLKLK